MLKIPRGDDLNAEDGEGAAAVEAARVQTVGPALHQGNER